jgi:hypothetical protein
MSLLRWFRRRFYAAVKAVKVVKGSSGQGRMPFRRTRLSVEQLEDRTVPSAAVWTQQPDYPPGSTATIYTSGFKVGEVVDFQIVNLTTGEIYTPPWSVADGGSGDLDGTADGNITTTWLVPQDALDTTLQVTARGETSGLTAVDTFTDSLSYSATIAPGTAVVGTPTTYTFTINNPDNNSASISSVKVLVPSISNDPSSLSGPSGWSVTLNTSTSPHEIELKTTTNPLTHGGSNLVFTFVATASSTGTATWTTNAYSSSDLSGTATAPTSQPAVTVSATGNVNTVTVGSETNTPTYGTAANNVTYTINTTWTGTNAGGTDPDVKIDPTTPLPTGVSLLSFNPTSVSSTTTSTIMTLSVAANAPAISNYSFTIDVTDSTGHSVSGAGTLSFN